YAISVSDPTLDGIPLSVLDDPFQMKRSITRYAGITCAVGGAIAGIFYTLSFHDNNGNFNSLSTNNSDNLADHTSRQWKQALRKRNTDLAGLIVGWTLMLAGSGGVYWSFTF
ncbi:MAG: hypothetical protein ACOCW2_03370, partial [Chitinivibrionales bacterium]